MSFLFVNESEAIVALWMLTAGEILEFGTYSVALLGAQSYTR